MKNIINIIYVLSVLCFAGCGDINSVHQEYLDRGETVYTGIVDSLKAHPGFNRARFTWLMQADPRITKIEISWKERGAEKTATVPAERSGNGNGAYTMETTLENLLEGTIYFEFVTWDNEGHRSLPVEVAAVIFGEDYTARLIAQKLTDIQFNDDGDLIATLTKAAQGVVRSVIRYENAEGAFSEVTAMPDETETLLPGAKSEGKYTVVTYFATGIDVVPITSAEAKLPKKG